MKKVFRILVVVVVILVILAFGARQYLTSQHMAAQVTSRLQAEYGIPMRAAEVDIGLGSSSLAGVQLLEKEEGASQEPWLTADSIEADVSLLSLLGGGASPKNLTLTHAAITLRFDKEGQLLTRLPTRSANETDKEIALPNLRIERSQITFQKEGVAPLIFTGINATLTSDGDRAVLTGEVAREDKSGLGEWTLEGGFDRPLNKGSVTFKSNGPIHVTQALLNQLPLVRPKVWQAVQLEGNTPVVATFRFDRADRDLHLHIELAPRETQFHVPSIDLDATGARGKVVIDDGLVKLRDVQGKAFGGTILTNADLDFRQTTYRLAFSRVEVQGSDMRRLPESWGLPRQIEGRLKGSAWLEVVLGKGKPQTRGEGQGEIDDARVGGQPTAEPVHLELHAKDGGFGFRNRNMKVGKRPTSLQNQILAPLLASELSLLQNPEPKETFLPVWVINALYMGLERTVHNLTGVGAQVVGWLGDQSFTRWRQQAKAKRSVDVNLKMRRVDLALFVKGLGLKLPFPVGGRLSFEVQASIPLDTSGDLKTYRVKGSAQVTEFRLADVELNEVAGNVDYSNGILDLKNLAGHVTDKPGPGTPVTTGTLHGAAQLDLVPLGELKADLTLDRVPITRFAGLAGAAGSVQGLLSGPVVVRAPAARLQGIDAWDATAKITATRIQAFGWAVPDSAANLRLKQGVLSMADLAVGGTGSPITGTAELRLSAPYRFGGKLGLRDWDLSAFHNLAPLARTPVPISGLLDGTANVEGTLQPLSARTRGTGTARLFKAYGADFDNVTFAWDSDDDRLKLTEVHARFRDGAVDGKAEIPLKPAVAGSVHLRMKKLDVGALVKALPFIPFGMEGRAGGTLNATLAAAAPGKKRAVTADLDLQARRLRIQGIPTEQLKGTVGFHDEAIDYRFAGNTLGGRIKLDGQMPSPGADPALVGAEGHLSVERAKLSRLSDIFPTYTEAFPLRGLLDLEIKFRHKGPDRAPVGTGRFVVTRLRWGGTQLAHNFQGEVLLTPQEWRLREITASFGEGLVRAQLAFNLHRHERSWFALSLERVDAKRVLDPWPSLAGKAVGLVEGHLRGRLGQEWSGSGDLFLGRGKVMGLAVTNLRLPLTWSLAPAEGRGSIAIPESSFNLALGRATGQATLSWGTGINLDGHIQFFNMELRQLLRQSEDLNQFGSGRVTGRVDFGGANMRSMDDLTATLQASLAQTQAFQYPVLQQVAPFLGVQTSSTFNTGAVRGRLARGVFRIQTFTLQGPTLQVLVEGNVTLAGRVDLDVRGQSGSLRPLTYITNRLVRLRVTGTVQNPTIRMEPFLGGD